MPTRNELVPMLLGKGFKAVGDWDLYEDMIVEVAVRVFRKRDKANPGIEWLFEPVRAQHRPIGPGLKFLKDGSGRIKRSWGVEIECGPEVPFLVREIGGPFFAVLALDR